MSVYKIHLFIISVTQLLSLSVHAESRENLISAIAKIDCFSMQSGKKETRIETVKRIQDANGNTKTLDIVYYRGADPAKRERLEFQLDASYHLEADTIEILGANAKKEAIHFLVDEREEAVDENGFAYSELSLGGKAVAYEKFSCKVERN